MRIKIYIKPKTNYYFPTLYILKIMEKNQNINFDFIASFEDADILWDHLNPNSQPIQLSFYNALQNGKFNLLTHTDVFKTSPIIYNDKGEKDTIATIFYMINCVQEFNYSEKNLDQYGRFRYESSYQHRFNVIEKNLVQQQIDLFFTNNNLKGIQKRSAFFISHDIDTIYGSFFQDGFWALKKMKIGVILTLIANELIRKPHWRNIDKIIKINSEYDIRSTFFWLVNKGKGVAKIKNADYDIRKERDLIKLVNEARFTNGLHKSCSKMGINEELQKSNLNSRYNRYHFLNFLPIRDWEKISDSELEFDCSLGFAERYGFRNSYGKSFQPYNIKKQKPYNFVEAPLHFMDGTFHKYMKVATNKISDIIINFFEDNPYNCDFSLLWHNTYFTKYKYNSFLDEYKKVLSYIYESKIESFSPEEIVKQNKIVW